MHTEKTRVCQYKSIGDIDLRNPQDTLFSYLFIYLFSHSQNLIQHEQKVLIKL